MAKPQGKAELQRQESEALWRTWHSHKPPLPFKHWFRCREIPGVVKKQLLGTETLIHRDYSGFNKFVTAVLILNSNSEPPCCKIYEIRAGYLGESWTLSGAVDLEMGTLLRDSKLWTLLSPFNPSEDVTSLVGL